MQWLAALCIRRPVFTWVLVLVLAVIGGASTFGLGVDRFPNIDFPIVVVTTVLPGASPEQMETEVSDRLEESINTASGIDQLRSTSYEGLSVIVVQFELDVSIADASQDVRDRVNRVLPNLPPDIDPPVVQRLDPSAAPIMQIALTGPGSPSEVTDVARRLVQRRLEAVSGVGQTALLGARARQIQLEVDPNKLAGYGMTISDVGRAVRTEDVNVPGGTVTRGENARLLRVEARMDTPEEFDQMPVGERGGAIVRLRDVGRARDTAEEPESIASVDGRDVVIVQIVKQSGANTVAVVDGLRERIAEIRPQLPEGYELTVVRDESTFIRNAIGAVEEHLVLGAALAALVVLVFLKNGRSTLITALAIPTSIISTFALIRAMGLTINTLTLLALTLSVGIVIDDAIVVLENIYRFLSEKKLPPAKAAELATREIGLAVLATTLSLIAVFLPIAFMGGIVGRFMKSFGLTMSFAIAVSLLVAFTLTPMLAARWLRELRDKGEAQAAPDEEEAAAESGPTDRAIEKEHYLEWQRGRRGHLQGRSGLYGRLEKAYVKLLAFLMRHRLAVVIAMLVTFGASIPLGIGVAKNFLPIDDESRFEISLRMPEGTSLDATRIEADRVAARVREMAGVARTVVTVGSPSGDPSGRGANEATVFVGLVDPRERDADQYTMMGRVRREILEPYSERGVRTFVSQVAAFGGGGTQAATIQYVLRGPDLEDLARYSDALLERARQIPGVVDADRSLVLGTPSLSVRVNRSRAADLGVTAADAADAIHALVGGVQVGTFTRSGEQYEVWLRGDEPYRNRPEIISNLEVPASGGRTARLGDVADIHETTGPAAIERLDRQRQVTVYANVTPGTSEAEVIAALDRAREGLHLPAAYTAELAGRSRELGRAGRSFGIALFLSLAFMYLVLAAQFESWIHPVTILIALPMTLPFALLSLLVLGQSLNIFSALGILVLFGVVKKNGILQIDHMRDLRRRGHDRADAVMIGNRDRLRPILMTTIAFVAGMIPLAVSSGAGSGTNRAMSAVIIGGQVLSLLLTLVATPVVYTLFDDLSERRPLDRPKRAVARLGRRLFRRRRGGVAEGAA